jgi:type IV pilus assembly protein PilQ
MRLLRLLVIGILSTLLLLAITAYAESNAMPSQSSDVELQALEAQQLSNGKIQLIFTFNKPLVVQPKDFSMLDSNRIIWDFPGVQNATGTTHKSFEVQPLQYAAFIQTSSRLRVLLTLTHDVQYSMRTAANKMYVTMVVGYQHRNTNNYINSNKRYQLEKVDFGAGKAKNSGQLMIDLSSPSVKTNIKDQGNNIVLTLQNTQAPSSLAHRYDVTDYHTPITHFEVKQTGNDTQITITGAGRYKHTIYQVNKKLMIDVSPLDEENRDIHSSKHYSGELVSLNFQNISVRAVLQLLAEFTGKNIIISNGVIGTITLRLKDIPWDQALDIILKTRGLSKREVGNVITIAPTAEINALEARELQDQRKLAELAPLYNETFHIKYGKASIYRDMLTGNRTEDSNGAFGLLTNRGKVILDERTNTLFIDDTAQQLKIIREFLNKTDVPVKQVMIEARIVSVSKTFERDLGINFKATRGGNLSNGGISMDFGGSPDVTAGHTLAKLSFSRLPSNFLLDLELSALESENDADIISSPRVITANNANATIQQGTQIPFNTQAASGGTTTQFINAVLKLDVTPQITPDNKVILKLTVTQDAPRTAEDGSTQIDNKQVNTNILVNNGETIVLGGIYERSRNHVETRVPFLSSIPILGNLFKGHQIKDGRSELLIFVTPKIITSDFDS